MNRLDIIAQQEKRHRSPSFPYFSLRECIKFIAAFYKKHRLNIISLHTAISSMGLSSTSSNSTRALSAIRGYGLINEKGAKDIKAIWISDLAKKILVNQENSQEWLEAVQQALHNEPMFQAIWLAWKEGLPSDDEIIRYLQLEHDFNERAARRFAAVIRDNYNYANLKSIKYPPPPDENMEDQQFEGGEEENLLPAIKSFTIPLIGGGIVLIKGPFPINRKNYDHILKWFDVMSDAIVKDDDANEK
jgi:hypothetical protein